MGLRSRANQRSHETAFENVGPRLPQRHRRLGKSNDRENGGMALAKTGVRVPRSLRDHRARDAHRALHLSRRMKAMAGKPFVLETITTRSHNASSCICD